MLTTNLEELKRAASGGYAIPAINTQGGNYDIIRACCKAAQEMRSPMILAHYVSTGAFSFVVFAAITVYFLSEMMAPMASTFFGRTTK